MTIAFAEIAATARELWRRSSHVLAPLTGLTLFVPQAAVLLLVPPLPRLPTDPQDPAAMQRWTGQASDWMSTHGAGYLLALLIGQFSILAVATFFLSRRATVGAALRHAAIRLPRFILATIAATAPIGALLLLALPLGAVAALVAIPMLWVLARTALVAPILITERVGAGRALVRSWRLTAGHTGTMAALVAATYLAGQALGSVIASLDTALAGIGVDNPVVRVIVDFAAAGVAWAAGVAYALVQVVAYRRLAKV